MGRPVYWRNMALSVLGVTVAGGGRRETWRDWAPGAPEPPTNELLTRAELLEMLRRRRVKATEADLRYWEYAGVLPRPVRQWHNGAVRAVYPPWFFGLVRQLRQLQRQGYPLDAIGPQVRAYVRATLVPTDAPPSPRPWSRENITLAPELTRALEHLADEHARITGSPTTRIVVDVFNERGDHTQYPYPLGPTES